MTADDLSSHDSVGGHIDLYNQARTYGTAAQLQNRTLIVKVTFSIDYRSVKTCRF
jgi:hypothetical protein